MTQLFRFGGFLAKKKKMKKRSLLTHADYFSNQNVYAFHLVKLYRNQN